MKKKHGTERNSNRVRPFTIKLKLKERKNDPSQESRMLVGAVCEGRERKYIRIQENSIKGKVKKGRQTGRKSKQTANQLQNRKATFPVILWRLNVGNLHSKGLILA